MSGSKVRVAVLAAPKGVKHLFTIGVLIACFLALQPHLTAISAQDLAGAVSRIAPQTWALALTVTALSFAALGAYDVMIHRWLNTGISTRRAAISGAGSIGVSQTVGFGLLSGTVARARLLPELSLFEVGRITATVGISFLGALAVVIALALVLHPGDRMGLGWIVPVGLGLGAMLVALSLVQPRWLPFRLPSLKVLGAVLAATVLDTLFAAVALWLLLPETAGITFGVLLPAFLIALAAGILSGTPAGLGPFEVTLLALIPTAPQADLLCAIVAFRLVYYGVPAVLAALVLLIGPGTTKTSTPPPKTAPVCRAEARLARLGEVSIEAHGPASHTVGRTGQCLVAVGPPTSGDVLTAPARDALAHQARREGLTPALYKSDARGTCLARKAGWSALHIADELVIDTAAFTLERPEVRRLRRKLRASQKAGVKISLAGPVLPVCEMTQVAQVWAKARGGERGFSMGRFAPDYVASQQVFLAHSGDRLVAFVTFNTCDQEWALDLVRFSDEAPDGTLYALISAAIEAAKVAKVPRLSLAAVQAGITAKIAARLNQKDGLAQFKTAFAPRRERRYLAAPSRFGLFCAGLDITRRIHRPVPLANSDAVHEVYDQFEFANPSHLPH